MIKNMASAVKNQTGYLPSAGKRDDSGKKKTRIQYEKPEALDIGPVGPDPGGFLRNWQRSRKTCW